MKLLIVEDDPMSARLLEATVRRLGHEVVIAGDGEEAWTLLSDGTLRTVISDWRMPRTDGLELCRRIRARGGDYVYFILLSMLSGTQENQQAAVEAGVDDFLVKPVNPTDLWMRLRVAERILNFTTKVRQLESFLPICGYCKKIRDDNNYWQQIETYFRQHTGTSFSHGVCPGCMESVVIPQMVAMGIKPPPPTCS